LEIIIALSSTFLATLITISIYVLRNYCCSIEKVKQCLEDSNIRVNVIDNNLIKDTVKVDNLAERIREQEKDIDNLSSMVSNMRTIIAAMAKEDVLINSIEKLRESINNG